MTGWLVGGWAIWKMMEFVNGKDDIPYMMEHFSHVPNHQTVLDWFQSSGTNTQAVADFIISKMVIPSIQKTHHDLKVESSPDVVTTIHVWNCHCPASRTHECYSSRNPLASNMFTILMMWEWYQQKKQPPFASRIYKHNWRYSPNYSQFTATGYLFILRRAISG